MWLACALWMLGLTRRALLVGTAAGLQAATPMMTQASDPETGVKLAISEERRLLRYYGPIESHSMLALNTFLADWAAESADPIDLHIQSYGGELMPALYTADLIASSPAPVRTHVDGYAASAATLLTVSGAERYITRHSSMMIHQLSTGFQGSYREQLEAAQNSATLMEHVIDVYRRHSNLTDAQLRQVLLKDVWWTSDVCRAYGLVDHIT